MSEPYAVVDAKTFMLRMDGLVRIMKPLVAKYRSRPKRFMDHWFSAAAYIYKKNWWVFGRVGTSRVSRFFEKGSLISTGGMRRSAFSRYRELNELANQMEDAYKAVSRTLGVCEVSYRHGNDKQVAYIPASVIINICLAEKLIEKHRNGEKYEP